MSASQPAQLAYRDYVADEEFHRDYAAYQRRYASHIRESDRVLLKLVRGIAAERPGERLRLLDAGCSTGNLLLHLKATGLDLELAGCDLVPSVIEDCRSDPALAGIRFEERDLLALGLHGEVDLLVVNAVFYLFGEAEYEQALASVREALASGGSLLVFDFFHPFEQDLTITERSATHPDGLTLHFRPYSWARAAYGGAGFTAVEFRPFAIPIDLERPADDAQIDSYTRRASSGERLLFRGALFQPWCHLVARAA